MKALRSAAIMRAVQPTTYVHVTWRVGEVRGTNPDGAAKVSAATIIVVIQAALAMKRLGPSTCFSLSVPAPPEPAPCPVFAALSYL